MLRHLAVTLALLLALSTNGYAEMDLAETEDKLESIQTLIDANIESRNELRASIREADPSQLPELQKELEKANDDLKSLRLSFEQIAIGAVDKSIFLDVDTQFNWREEITLILQPIVENLKALTEKPHKINQLNALIELKENRSETISHALVALAEVRESATNDKVAQSLDQLQRTWAKLDENNATELDLAQAQLDSLQTSDVTWRETLQTSAQEFLTGRGLTLLYAVCTAIVVWLLTRALLWLVQSRAKQAQQNVYRTRRRLAQYAYRAFVFALIWVAVIAVFYVRGDLLLLGLSLIAAATLAIGLRQAVPRFISEAQLLLNVGSIREQERVLYEGLPWQVEAINMYSILRNPELAGVLRLPLRDLAGLTSRPNSKEVWFPTSKGDYVLLGDERLLEVCRQTPEVVELRDAGGSPLLVKSADFFSWDLKNLSRGETFGVAGSFGVDYQLQTLSLNEVPTRMRQDLEAALAKTEFSLGVKGVMVELSSAGASSLDYLVYITLDSSYAKSYYKVKRVIQQTCVATCTEQGWNIPFPHLTVQQLQPS